MPVRFGVSPSMCGRHPARCTPSAVRSVLRKECPVERCHRERWQESQTGPYLLNRPRPPFPRSQSLPEEPEVSRSPSNGRVRPLEQERTRIDGLVRRVPPKSPSLAEEPEVSRAQLNGWVLPLEQERTLIAGQVRREPPESPSWTEEPDVSRASSDGLVLPLEQERTRVDGQVQRELAPSHPNWNRR